MFPVYETEAVTRARLAIKLRAMDDTEAAQWKALLHGCKCQSHGKKCLVSFRKEEYHHDRVCSFNIDHMLLERHRIYFDLLSVFWFMRTALRMERNNYGGYDAMEGFAGSAPLAIMELIASRFPHNDRVNGRWEQLVDTNLLAPLHWKPNDADYFIIAETAGLFFTRVNQIVALLYKVMRDIGNHLVVRKPYRNLYAFPNQPIWIVNVRISNLITPISFIQAPNSKNMEDVLDKFDIDVARVFYDCASSGNIIVNSNILERIRIGFAEVDDFLVGRGGPTAFETKKITSTIGRMHECGEGERKCNFVACPEFQIDLNRVQNL